MRQDHVPWRFSAVAFDLDGLLINTEPIFRETMRTVLQRRGITFDPVFMQSMMGVPAAQSLPRMRDHFGLSEAVTSLADECKHTFIEILGNSRAPLMQGVHDVLRRIRERRITCAIVTSSSRAFVDQVFGPHQLLDHFAFVITSDNVTRGKPYPDVYQLAAKHFGITPDDMVVFEDSPNGLLAAKAAGARCIVIPHEHTNMDAVSIADAVVPSLDSHELRSLLGWQDAPEPELDESN
jgi:HAD superfamily hydrolase (TIGR01509 family)